MPSTWPGIEPATLGIEGQRYTNSPTGRLEYPRAWIIASTLPLLTESFSLSRVGVVNFCNQHVWADEIPMQLKNKASTPILNQQAEQNPRTPLPVNSETDSADEIEGTRVESDQQKSGDGARLQSELTSVCDNELKTSSNTSAVKTDLQGGSTSSWNEMMDADDISHRSTSSTQHKDIAAQKTSKGGNRAGRLHPYKHEGSKLGFPPLRVTD
ncbi:hypothetical protein ANN_06328 [Periplaneta americana]|uniref:Uncharacterized protein n=1 Tax=Periplaneta americana TaxID=6978 RepID=A0ABQ8TE52_PERAM|nr:hypothetical protein ANN_06328 [Periplaneta americana]